MAKKDLSINQTPAGTGSSKNRTRSGRSRATKTADQGKTVGTGAGYRPTRGVKHD